MAPFPEAEIMTIKRLEVAIRRNDFKLLKDGAYKLHEKFHAGHKFEYLELLKEILLEVSTNPSVPTDVREILTMTIEDILTNSYGSFSKADYYREQSEQQALNATNQNTTVQQATISQEQYQKPVFEEVKREVPNQEIKVQENPIRPTEQSVLNNNPQPIKIEPEVQDPKANAFEAFSPSPANQNQNRFDIPKKYFTNSPFSAEPFKEFKPAIQPERLNAEEEKKEEVQQVNVVQNVIQESQIQREIAAAQQNPSVKVNEVYEDDVVEDKKIEPEATEDELLDVINSEEVEVITEKDETPVAPVQEVEKETMEASQGQLYRVEAAELKEIEPEVKKEEKTVAVVYSQDSSNEKIKNIKKLRELIENQESSIGNVLELIAKVATQANSNVMELQGVFEKLSKRETTTNFITNCQSAMLTNLLDNLEISYEINESGEDVKLNIVPMYGLANLFVCENCEETHLVNNDQARPLILECPSCKYAMYPDFYASEQKSQLNLDYYNEALINLANSKIWLLVHPTYNDKITSNLIETALKISTNVEEIFVLDKDYNIRETYKNIISQIKPDVKVYIQSNILENFYNAI